MNTIQVSARGIDGDSAYANVAAVSVMGYGEIEPETAVTIAAMWQSPGTVGHVLAGFASGAPVDREELLDDIYRTRKTEGYFTGGMSAADKDALDCLSTFVIHYGR
jgi:hypothetical protein